ncbi:hypothetical protein TBLA_0I01950 [Henningerozyma blattae CBS 6284]|uniref:Small ribosomal subunit protein uS10m n=1 Tax=Henningerozyma blattae (strain ATCC 34711 / CBS 6284 / DSM 70876 / NBRC 10599 / NRRL Y-10934 / UCD 77-7) TaxID=1071380 RepID=I2H902_HENB6|nr:hypothetical protein TBLA_0I01950 [Tetrapisispora blattae CBS 6284]CCH62854.1 hypothetical protein TBLA_0I01950 [Tetrapisispora blattae CBS 6284]
MSTKKEINEIGKQFLNVKWDKPLPINVESLYFAPLKIEPKHHNLIANLQLRAYDYENLDFYCDFILRCGFYLGIPLTGPKPLPIKRERWTVIKSPFANAKKKENFERKTYKRLIRVWDTNLDLLQFFIAYISKYGITGVGLKCNIFESMSLEECNNEIQNKPSTSQINSNQVDLLNDLFTTTPESIKIQNNDERISLRVKEILENPEFKKYLK